MNNERSQATFLMVLGFAILILSSLYFIIAQKSDEEIIITQTTQVDTAALEVNRIEEYIQGCLDQSARQTIDLLGAQGGMIYRDQGGPINKPTKQQVGRIALEYNDVLVAYHLYPPRFVPPPFATAPPQYPHETFPYTDESKQNINYTGYFGLTTLPPLYAQDGPNSFEFQLEHTVLNQTTQCVDFSLFEEEGLEFAVGTRDITLTIGPGALNYELIFPLDITNTVTGEKAELRRFETSQSVRLGAMHAFVENLLFQDSNDINHSLLGRQQLDKDYTIQVLENIHDQDNLLIVKDTASQIRGRGFEFVLGLHNRPPALFYHNQTALSLPAQSSVTESLLTTTLGLAQALDPDGDRVSFSYSFPQIPGQPNTSQNPVTVSADTTLRVGVSDGELTDYQDIQLTTFFPNQDNACIEQSGCYDIGGNLIARNQLKNTEFSHYLADDFCQATSECLCPEEFASTKSIITDPDQTRTACFCVRGSEWTGSSCCGDDISDCGSIDNNWLCAINSQFTESSLYSASRDKQRIVHLGCNDKSMVSNGNAWLSCDQETVTRIDGVDYACASQQGTLKWHECCGTGPCKSRGDGVPLYIGDSLIINGQQHYCSSTKRFTTDPGINRPTCEASGNRWTGTFCCERGEYYADAKGCWNGQVINDNRLLNGKIYFKNGDFRACSPTSAQLRLRDEETGRQLVDVYAQCNLPNGWQYFCSPVSSRWITRQLHWDQCVRPNERVDAEGDSLPNNNGATRVNAEGDVITVNNNNNAGDDAP